MVALIGFFVDKPGYRKTLLCMLGFHKASRYVIERVDGIDYFICKRCGERFKIIEKQKGNNHA